MATSESVVTAPGSAVAAVQAPEEVSVRVVTTFVAAFR
jgi:hypothetical protein